MTTKFFNPALNIDYEELVKHSIQIISMTKQPWNQGHSIKIKFLNPDNAVIYIYKKDEEEKRDLDLRYLDFIIKEGEID